MEFEIRLFSVYWNLVTWLAGYLGPWWVVPGLWGRSVWELGGWGGRTRRV